MAPAPDVLLPVRDLAPAVRLVSLDPVPGYQEAPGEDQEPAEVVLIEQSDAAEEIMIEGHLGYERTQDRPPVGSGSSGGRGNGRRSPVDSPPPVGRGRSSGVAQAQVEQVRVASGKEIPDPQDPVPITQGGGGRRRLTASELRADPHDALTLNDTPVIRKMVRWIKDQSLDAGSLGSTFVT